MRAYPAEIQLFIAQNVKGRSTYELAELVNAEFGLNVTRGKMRSYMKNHGLTNGLPTGLPARDTTEKYPADVRAFIRANYVGAGHQDMADLLNAAFGTEYTKGQMKSLYARWKLNSGKTGRFPKGNIPVRCIQKGEHMSPETEFKKGNRPHNTRHVGDEVLRSDGYVWVKIKEHKWREKHVLIWEAAHGPRPKGHKVLFGDGNRQNFDLDNLILITDGQLATLNKKKLIKSDAELTRIGITIADVSMKMSQRQKKKPTKGEREMPKKLKFSDEQLIELLNNPELKNNKQVIDALGVSSYGALNNRLNQLRKVNGLPMNPRGKQKPEPVDTDSPACNDRSVDISSPPAEEILNWDDIQPDARLLRLGKPIKVVSIGPAAMTIEDRFGFKGSIERDYFEKNRDKFTKGKNRTGGGISMDDIQINSPPAENLSDIEAKRPTNSEAEEVERNLMEGMPRPVFDLEMEPITDDYIAPEYFFDQKPQMPEQVKQVLAYPGSHVLFHNAAAPKLPCPYLLKDCDLPDVSKCVKCPDYLAAMDEAEKEWVKGIGTYAATIEIAKDIDDQPLVRPYLVKINDLLDLMVPLTDDSLRERTKLLAERILFAGIDKEASHE